MSIKGGLSLGHRIGPIKNLPMKLLVINFIAFLSLCRVRLMRKSSILLKFGYIAEENKNHILIYCVLVCVINPIIFEILISKQQS